MADSDMNDDDMPGTDYCLKMLVSDSIAGAVIGKSGGNISGIQKASNSRLSISSTGEYFPLTNYRVILIKGSFEAINIAQSTLWRIIESALATKGSDDATISGHILIPEGASGLIIGRGGSNVKRMAAECGVVCGLDSKEEVMFGERVMSISGPLDGCIAAVAMVLEKYMDDPVASQYANKTTRYSSSGMFGYGTNKTSAVESASGPGFRVLSAQTTILVSVADAIIGSVLGVKGSVLREMEQISGATIAVSDRGEMSNDHKERRLTITGEPAKAQAALILVTQKLGSQAKQTSRDPR